MAAHTALRLGGPWCKGHRRVFEITKSNWFGELVGFAQYVAVRHSGSLDDVPSTASTQGGRARHPPLADGFGNDHRAPSHEHMPRRVPKVVGNHERRAARHGLDQLGCPHVHESRGSRSPALHQWTMGNRWCSWQHSQWAGPLARSES